VGEIDDDAAFEASLLKEIENAKDSQPAGRMTVREKINTDIDSFPQAVFEEEDVPRDGDMIKELDEDKP